MVDFISACHDAYTIGYKYGVAGMLVASGGIE
jgi:hypothetical protein